MNNQLMARVLFSNKLVTEAQIEQYWGSVTPDKDIGKILCKAGVLAPQMYERVAEHVMQMEAKTAKPAAVHAQPTAPVAAVKPVPVVPPVVPKAPVPPEAPHREKVKAAPEAIALEGNNPYGAVSADVQVEQVVGLESTSMAPVSVAPVEELAKEEKTSVASETASDATLPDRFAVTSGEGDVKAPDAVTPATPLVQMLAFARKYKATDIYLQPGFQIMMRVAGTQHYVSDAMVENSNLDEWLSEAAKGFADGYAPVVGRDFSKTLALPGAGRARLTVTWEDTSPACAIRLIPAESMTLDKFYLPPFCNDFLSLKNGLVLIAGPSGSGRSTMMTTFGETIAASRPVYVQTIEKPIERLLKNAKGIVVQKEVGLHALSGEDALRCAIADDADVILFDHLESVDELWLLLQAASAGALVFATASGNSVLEMLTRLLDSAPESRRKALAFAIAEELKGVLAQHLIPVVQGQGQILAVEAMKVTSSIANFIRRGELSQIPAAMSASKNQGQTLDDSLQSLVESGYIEGVEAWQRATDSRRFMAYRPDARGKGV